MNKPYISKYQLIEHAKQRGKLIATGEHPRVAADINTQLTIEDTKSLANDTVLSRQRWLKIATSDPDRAGDIITVEGADTTNFERNPQFLWQHGLTNEPVHTIGKIIKLVKTQTAIYALAEYATADESPLAERIFKLDEAGLLPANSIGFTPLEWTPNEYGGLTFTKWELIEVSKVELPCNPYAIDDGAPKGLSIAEAVSLI